MKTKVTLPNKTIKAMARKMLKGRYFNSVAAVLAANILVSGPEYLIGSITSNLVANEVASVISFVISMLMEFGLASYFIAVFRNERAGLERLGQSTQHVSNIILLSLMSYVQIFLRTLLLIVPGIIRAIENSLAMFILADNPERSPMECLAESQKIMNGNKMKYIGLHLSFIGWYILSMMPGYLYQVFCIVKSNITLVVPSFIGVTPEQYLNQLSTYAQTLSNIQNPIVTTLLSMISVFLAAYVMTARIAFYDIASGNLILARTVNPDEKQEDTEVVDLDD